MDGSVEESSHFQPKYIKSHFTHIYAVVCYQVFYYVLVATNFYLQAIDIVETFCNTIFSSIFDILGGNRYLSFIGPIR